MGEGAGCVTDIFTVAQLTVGVSGEHSEAVRDGMRRPVSRRSLKISCKEDGLEAQKGDRP